MTGVKFLFILNLPLENRLAECFHQHEQFYIWSQPDFRLKVIEVTLTGTDADGNTIEKTTFTDENGFYKFENLLSGEYKVAFDESLNTYGTLVKEDASDDEKVTSKVDPESETAEIQVTITNQNVTDRNVGVKLATVSGTVYEDTDQDDLKKDEPRFKDIEVTLKDKDGNTVQTTKTDENGNYTFPDVEPGDYTIQIEEPDGYEVINKKGDFRTDEDSGLVKKEKPTPEPEPEPVNETHTVSGTVWFDKDYDGKLENSEVLLEGITVKLIDKATGKTVQETKTDKYGYYSLLKAHGFNRGMINIIRNTSETFQ